MDDNGNPTDELIRRAIGDGANLPNSGKRLSLDDPYTPDDMQLAHKMLKESGFVPSWIADSRELDDLRESLLRRVETTLRRGADIPARSMPRPLPITAVCSRLT